MLCFSLRRNNLLHTKRQFSLRMKLLIFSCLSFISFSPFLSLFVLFLSLSFSLSLTYFLFYRYIYNMYSLSRFLVIVLGLLGINTSSSHVVYVKNTQLRQCTRHGNESSTKTFARSCVRNFVSRRRGTHFECEFEMYGET